MTGYLRDALSERLRPRMRMVLQPGLLPLFQAFVDEASHPHSDHRSVVILAARRGIGVCYHGRIEAKDCNESILAISSELPSGVRTTYFVPRANIEAWFGWKQVTDGLVRTLRAQGWVEPTADESR